MLAAWPRIVIYDAHFGFLLCILEGIARIGLITFHGKGICSAPDLFALAHKIDVGIVHAKGYISPSFTPITNPLAQVQHVHIRKHRSLAFPRISFREHL